MLGRHVSKISLEVLRNIHESAAARGTFRKAKAKDSLPEFVEARQGHGGFHLSFCERHLMYP